MQNNIQEMAIELLMDSPIGEQLEKAVQIATKVQENLYALVTKEDSDELLRQKIGTVLVFAVIEKAKLGKKPKELSSEDWKEIAQAVSDLAIVGDGQKYSEFVFLKYAEYIQASAIAYGSFFSEVTKQMVLDLSKEIVDKTKQLEAGEIDEVSYIDDCLWISMDAMIKMLTAMAGSTMGEAYSDLARAMGMIAFEYGRYTLYKKEQNLLAEYLAKQQEVDKELEEKYEEYKIQLEKQKEQFEILMKEAFSTDFRTKLKGSVEIAQSVGVDEKEILHNLEEIDDFFM